MVIIFCRTDRRSDVVTTDFISHPAPRYSLLIVCPVAWQGSVANPQNAQRTVRVQLVDATLYLNSEKMECRSWYIEPAAQKGRQAAMEKGIQFGRKPHKGSEKAKEVMAATGVSRATYFRLKKSA